MVRLTDATPDDLVAALRRRHLPLAAAARAGLLGRQGHERFAGRVVVPEIREHGPLWLIGRALTPDKTMPKYLGLPGRKPLRGWGAIQEERAVYLTEGPFDWLTLRAWGYPALALAGTHVRREVLGALARFPRVYLVLDSDAAGQAATLALGEALGTRAVPVPLPWVKDVADLALRRDGHAAFRHAVARAARAAA